MDTKSLSRKKSEGEMVDANDDENLNQGHKPFLMGLHSYKITPIGYDLHQVEVPPWIPPLPGSLPPAQQLRKKEISRQPKPTFLASRISEETLEQYLAFVQNYYEEKIPDYFSQGSISLERTKAKALQFLHKMDYNVIRAKFYTLFPTYITYNCFRRHDPLNISDQQMEKKTRDYLESLKNTKEKDTEKWIQDLQQCLQNRTPIAKFIGLIEVGKVNKLEVPQHIKEQIQRAQKAGKQIKKSLTGNKYTIDLLREKKKIIEDHKIITSEMISLEDTVNRCEDWLRKLQNFQETYFKIDQNGNQVQNKGAGKIQFRHLNVLVNEYNNLPLNYLPFQHTVKKIHTETSELLDAMPTFNRVAKTRTAKEQTVNKISYSIIKRYLKRIDQFPVWHEQFSNFEINMRESIELIERMSMFLEDPLSEKTSKILNNYIKLISDVQIDNNIEKRLKQRQEYNEIMEKIKREITNPTKVESIKEAYNKLKEKGIKEMEDTAYQEKILLYLGWHESQQKLKEPKPILTKLDLVIRELEIKKKMVNVQSFKAQLESAKKQLNISREDLEQNYKRLEMQKSSEIVVGEMLKAENPNLQEMIEKLKECIDCGLSSSVFEQLYETIIKYYEVLLKIHYVLKVKPENLESDIEGDYYFTAEDCDYTLNIISYQNELKDLKTKEGADSLLMEIRQNTFPRYMKECTVFEEFMKKGEEWAENVRQMIKNFSQKGENIDVKELEESKYFIHSRAIKEEIGRIELIMKWRQKIKKKLDDGKAIIFDQSQEEFLKNLEKDLVGFEAQNNSYETAKNQFLEYSKENNAMINKILEKISSESQVDNICKLSEMNKFHRQIQKEIQKHHIDDKIILELKCSFHDEINLADQWKERYLMIKRCEKKKNSGNKKDEAGEEEKEEPAIQRQSLFSLQQPDKEMSHSQNQVIHKKRFVIRNVEFTTNFKFLILILEFFKGYKLKFTLEELLKLKNTLSQIYKFIQHFDAFNEKIDPSDLELSNLQAEGAKIQLFIREYWTLKKKNQFVLAWKQIADTILDSVPIVNMELKARKPEELLEVLAIKKLETEEAHKTVVEQKNTETFSHKRQRKPNSLYSNNEITLFFDDNIGQKIKKRKKGGNGDTEYRNTAVASQAKKNARNRLEDIERTQALLKGQISANFMIQDPKEYCICRFGQPNQNTTMVQCEGKCEQWFHIECVGIKKHQAKGDTSYVCISCNYLYGLKTTGNFYWNYRQKISSYALQEIVEEGKNLGVHTQQLKKIKVIDEKLQIWKQNIEDLFTSIARADFHGKPITDFEQKIYQLFLMSFWLPTFQTETQVLRRLLLISRNHNEFL